MTKPAQQDVWALRANKIVLEKKKKKRRKVLSTSYIWKFALEFLLLCDKIIQKVTGMNNLTEHYLKITIYKIDGVGKGLHLGNIEVENEAYGYFSLELYGEFFA